MIFPQKAILTEDPHSARILVAHHLEHAVSADGQNGMSVYSGSYKCVPIALVCGPARPAHQYAKQLGSTQIVYMGGCVSTMRRYPVGAVVLCGGDSVLLQKAQSAAAELSIPVVTGPCPGIVFDPIEASVLTVTENTETGERLGEDEWRSRLYPAANLVFETLATN